MPGESVEGIAASVRCNLLLKSKAALFDPQDGRLNHNDHVISRLSTGYSALFSHIRSIGRDRDDQKG